MTPGHDDQMPTLPKPISVTDAIPRDPESPLFPKPPSNLLESTYHMDCPDPAMGHNLPYSEREIATIDSWGFPTEIFNDTVCFHMEASDLQHNNLNRSLTARHEASYSGLDEILLFPDDGFDLTLNSPRGPFSSLGTDSGVFGVSPNYSTTLSSAPDIPNLPRMQQKCDSRIRNNGLDLYLGTFFV